MKGGLEIITHTYSFLDQTKEQVVGWLSTSEKWAIEWVGAYGRIFIVLMLLQITAYSYFYTTIIFTNHTFPNAWLYPYPSFKTWGEGRWLADLIILAQGGSGVQSFQMIFATALQALNGILFAHILGLRKKYAILCIAATLCLYPAFLDYYSFTVDHVTFVLSDTFALLGARAFIRNDERWRRIIYALPLFLLAIASYQPKIALVSFLACSILLLRVTQTPKMVEGVSPVRSAILDVLAMAMTVSVALGLYWLTTKLLLTADLGARVNINTPHRAIAEILASYAHTIAAFTKNADGIPPMLQFIPALGIVVGVMVALIKAWRIDVRVFVIALVILALIPIALRASYVINSSSWQGSGRIIAANGYCLVFFLALGFRMKLLRVISAAVVTICLYFFVVLATQESNAAAFKTTYDINIINRIIARAEMTLGEPIANSQALVVAGHYPRFDRTQYVRNTYGYQHAQVHTRALEVYRQPEIFNFFIGKSVFRQPTKAEVDRALESMRDKAPWPSRESLYMVDNIIVIMLEPYRVGMPVTWATD